MSDKSRILDEHFWFTATTLAVNISLFTTNNLNQHIILTKIASTIVSLYATFLIIHRSAAHADKIRMPESLQRIPEANKTFIHKAMETWVHFKLVPKHFLFVIFEFSGSLFYIILLVLSCIAVWLRKIPGT